MFLPNFLLTISKLAATTKTKAIMLKKTKFESLGGSTNISVVEGSVCVETGFVVNCVVGAGDAGFRVGVGFGFCDA